MLDLPRRGGSNTYPQSIIWRKNKKIRYTPLNHSFNKIYTFHGHVFMMMQTVHDAVQQPCWTLYLLRIAVPYYLLNNANGNILSL